MHSDHMLYKPTIDSCAWLWRLVWFAERVAAWRALVDRTHCMGPPTSHGRCGGIWIINECGVRARKGRSVSTAKLCSDPAFEVHTLSGMDPEKNWVGCTKREQVKIKGVEQPKSSGRANPTFLPCHPHIPYHSFLIYSNFPLPSDSYSIPFSRLGVRKNALEICCTPNEKLSIFVTPSCNSKMRNIFTSR